MFKELHVESSEFDEENFVKKLWLMNVDTYKPILEKARNEVKWFTPDDFAKKIKIAYPHIWAFFSSEESTLSALQFYIAYSSLEYHTKVSSIKLGLSAYDPNVPRNPKKIRREMHIRAYQELMPFLVSKYGELLLFVQLPEMAYPIISIFNRLEFTPINDSALLDTVLGSHNIDYTKRDDKKSNEGIRYQVRQKHSGVDDGSFFLAYVRALTNEQKPL